MLCGHNDAVMCASVSVEFGIVASGSKDRRVLLHRIHNGRLLRSFSDRREEQLQPEDIKGKKRRWSAKKDKEELLSASEVSMGGVELVSVSRVSGTVVSYYTRPNVVCVHSLNGVLLQQLNLDEEEEPEMAGSYKAMKVMPRRKDDKEFLLMGGAGGIVVRVLPSLELLCRLDIPSSPVVCLSFIEDSFVFAGLEDGQVAVFPLFIVHTQQ